MKSRYSPRLAKWFVLALVATLYGLSSIACIDSRVFTNLLVQSIGTFVTGLANQFFETVFALPAA